MKKHEKNLKLGFTHYVVAFYDYADKEAGDIISKHKTYKAAEKKANGSTMWGIRDIREYD